MVQNRDNLLVFLFDVKGSVSSTHTATQTQQEVFYGFLREITECAVRAVDDALQIVKSTGDGFYVIGPDPAACLLLFVEINHVARQFLFKDKAIEIRCGAHFGPITLVGTPATDLIGDGANITARSCSNANPGEMVVTDALYQMIRTNSFLQTLHLEANEISKPKAKGCEDVRMWSIRPTKEILVVGDGSMNAGRLREMRRLDLRIPEATDETKHRIELRGYTLLSARGKEGILYAWAFGKKSGYPVESAAFNQRVSISPSEEDKATSSYTASVSAGCILQPSALTCRFCHTGRLPFRGSLTPAEIALQNVFMVITDMTCVNFEDVRGHMREFAYMGHGEPGLSYLQVREGIRITDEAMAVLRQPVVRHLISTCGIPEMIKALAKDINTGYFRSRVTLHFSLHAANGRKDLMPIDTTYPHKEVIRALSEFHDETGQKPSVAIMLFDHFRPKGARKTFTMDEKQLAGILDLLEPEKHRLSLCIPNITPGIGNDQGVSNVAAERLLSIALERRFEAKLFASFGTKEHAGCGMLHGRHPAKPSTDLKHNVRRAIALIQQLVGEIEAAA